MNDIALSQTSGTSGVLTERESSRATQEVQSAMVVAKRFPRDQSAALDAMLQACKRTRLAEVSQYSYPRGKEIVTGPSIRLAEMMAQSWGNLDFGIVELEQRNGESIVQTYCWDMQTNVRQTRVFAVPHKRVTKKGSYAITDPRDVYEMIANVGARRLRACILGVIPGDIQESCIDACNKTLSAGTDALGDRVVKMCAAFGSVGVTIEQIEKRLQHPVGAITEMELVKLRGIYTSLKDGIGKIADWFEGDKVTVDDDINDAVDFADELNDAIKAEEKR